MTRAKHPSKTIMILINPSSCYTWTYLALLTLNATACLYGFVIVDDYSRYTWVHIILYKIEVQDVFRRFVSHP